MQARTPCLSALRPGPLRLFNCTHFPQPLAPEQPVTSIPTSLPFRRSYASTSSSSTRWKTRQSRDPFAAAARTAQLKSRAAYKLLELDQRHRLFRRDDTVIDLGFAPGAWSQVAFNRTGPGGRVVGVDVIPAQPPRGVSSIQGNFLSTEVRQEVRAYVADWGRGRARTGNVVGRSEEGRAEAGEELPSWRNGDGGVQQQEEDEGMVDVVLSDMSAPWAQTSGMWIRSVSNPYFRMMNTSGISFRDHAGSMDLCLAALTFCYDTLRPGGHFVCKFFQGAEDKAFEMRLKKLFEKVVREKPEASRKESKEAYFVALRRKQDIDRATVFPDEEQADTEDGTSGT